MTPLDVGDDVPEFDALQSSGGSPVASTDLTSGPAVLFFYPKADTPG